MLSYERESFAATSFFSHGGFVIFNPHSIMDNFNPILKAFLTAPHQYTIIPFGQGLINRTYRVDDAAGKPVFILQQLNTHIFARPQIIAGNITRAAALIHARNQAYHYLQFLKTDLQEDYHIDEEGRYWRMSVYIPHAANITIVDSPQKAYLTAFEFARFTLLLTDHQPEKFISAIPQFHDLNWRFHQFEKALRSATQQRKEAAKPLTEFLFTQQHLLTVYQQMISNPAIPIRIQHADTKISNILFDEKDGLPMGVIDWDTLMPGYFISDLGDMVRTMVAAADENETDWNRMEFRKDYYEAIVSGYVDVLPLTAEEQQLIPYAGKLMTYMQALRFLTDYFNGDIYYATSYVHQNLYRASNQCHLLQLLNDNIK